MLTLDVLKDGVVGVLSTMFSIHKCLPFLHNFNFKKMKKNENHELETTIVGLGYVFVLQTMSFLLNSFFSLDQ
jgi:hypothetical protein